MILITSIQLIVPLKCSNLLYPRESETREVKSLDGIWQFLPGNAEGGEQGFREKWHLKPLSNEVLCTNIYSYDLLYKISF